MISKIKEFIYFYLNPYFWINPYFVSFVEMGIFNPKYKDYIAGRIEVWTHWSQYDEDEYRFLTKDIKGFYKFRDRWDFRDINWFQLQWIKKYVKKHFNDSVNNLSNIIMAI